SAFNNGKADAVAGVGVYFGEKDPRNIGRPLGPGKQTNQRAELMAVRLALDSASGHKKVVIRSDSKYAIGCVTDWYYKWKLQSWRKAAGIFRENHHLIESTVHRIQKRKRDGATTGFFWVKGHAGDPGNEAADRLASKGS
ncbi:ribonuclease H-like protein, partial [Cucurbitaria berberidis CBS 394.84]